MLYAFSWKSVGMRILTLKDPRPQQKRVLDPLLVHVRTEYA